MGSLKQIVEWFHGHDSYELRNRVIHRRVCLREESLPIDEIEGWSIYPEMGVDVVEVRLKAGGTVIWFDYNNDLTAILRTVAEERAS